MAWMLARTEPRQERSAKFNVERNPCAEAYLPVFWDPVVNKIYPLFPSYLFVRTTPMDVWGFLRRTTGIFQVVMRGKFPDTMPDEQLEILKEREFQGLVQLQKFEPGEKVEVAGKLSWSGIYVGMKSKDRCRVLMEMFGRKVETTVNLQQLRHA
jgi:transcription antitermination factor NusG